MSFLTGYEGVLEYQGNENHLQRIRHQIFEEILKPHVKQTSSNINHERWRNPTVKTGVLPHCITSKNPGAEGCRWRIFEIEDNSSVKFSC